MFRDRQQFVMVLLGVVAGWLLLSVGFKSVLLAVLWRHFGLIVLLSIQTLFVAWLMKALRRTTLAVMSVAAYVSSHWAATGMPTVLLLQSGDWFYPSVVTPLMAGLMIAAVRLKLPASISPQKPQ